MTTHSGFPEDPPSLLGSVLSGYRIEEVLEHSGPFSLCRAHQLSVGRTVVLKVLRLTADQDRTLVSAFVREARTAGGLRHRAIVEVHEVCHEGGCIFYSLDYVPGQNLVSRVSTEGALPWQTVRSLLQDAADAFLFAEERGIVHGCLHPGHLVFAADGRLQVLNLGLATGLEHGLHTGGEPAVSRLAFMAPEQIESGQSGHRSDIYALGCCFTYALIGRSLFVASSREDILRAKRLGLNRLDDHRLAAIPLAGFSLLTKMTAPQPGSRYESFRDVVASLAAVPRPVVGGMRKRGKTLPLRHSRAAQRFRSAPDGLLQRASILAAVAVLTVVAFVAWSSGRKLQVEHGVDRSSNPPTPFGESPTPPRRPVDETQRLVVEAPGENDPPDSWPLDEASKRWPPEAPQDPPAEGSAPEQADVAQGILSQIESHVVRCLFALDFDGAAKFLAEPEAKGAGGADLSERFAELGQRVEVNKVLFATLQAASIPQWRNLGPKLQGCVLADTRLRTLPDFRACLLKAAFEAFAETRRDEGIAACLHGRVTSNADGTTHLSYDFSSPSQLEDFVPISGVENAISVQNGRVTLNGEYRLLRGEPFRKRLRLELVVEAPNRDDANINVALWTRETCRVTYLEQDDPALELDVQVPSGAELRQKGSYSVFGVGYMPRSAAASRLRSPEVEPVLFPCNALMAGLEGKPLHTASDWKCIWGETVLRPFKGRQSVEIATSAGFVLWKVNARDLSAQIGTAERDSLESILGPDVKGSVTLFTNGKDVVLDHIEISADLDPGWTESMLHRHVLGELKRRVPGVPWDGVEGK
jgi:serine/threonine protein kinase